jgi:hypothetical protein
MIFMCKNAFQKALAAVTVSALLCSTICFPVFADGIEKTSGILTYEEDGVWYTVSTSDNSKRIHSFPEDYTERFCRTYYGSSFAVKVTCTDDAALEAAFSDDYFLTKQEDGSYLFFEYNEPHTTYLEDVTLDEAKSTAETILASPLVTSASVQWGYCELDSSLLEPDDTFYIYADTPLTASSFDWVDDDITVTIEDEKTVKFSSSRSYWETILYVLNNGMENIPGVTAIDPIMIHCLLAPPYQYDGDSIETYLKGDMDGDGVVAVEDAVAILTQYARSSAGLSDAVVQTEASSGYLLGDSNGDGELTIEDAVWVLERYARQCAGIE